MLNAFKFLMYPTEEQKQQLIRTFGCVRFTYNHLLKERQKSWQQTGVADFSLTPATLKKEYPFLKEVDSLALANAQLNLDRAFRNYFKGRASFPKLKTKKSMWQSYTTNNQTHTVYLKNGHLKLPKQKELIKINQHRPVEGTIRSATISARYNEEFYVALLCDVSSIKKESSAKWIGIAYHPKTLIETSQPIEVTLPKFDQTEEKLQHAQRKLSVKVRSAHHRKTRLDKASNYQKQKRKVMDLYLKQKNQREDYLEQLSGKLVKQYDYLFVESFPKEEAHADFSIHDWHKLITKLRYKSQWYNKKFLLINTDGAEESNSVRKSQVLEQLGRHSVIKE